MTLVAAWIRKNSPQDQLIVASDSRLSFGARWDCCPKIFPLSRNDSVLAFCGDTFFAYPILLQLSKAIPNFDKAQSRELDITDLRAHFIKIIDQMRSQVTGLPKPPEMINTKDFTLLFAGYSTKFQQFKAWALRYNQRADKYTYRALSFHKKAMKGTKPFLFVGDDVGRATRLLTQKLKDRNRLTEGGLDMEPLEVLVEMSEDPQYESIGGPPQLVKVYSHINVLPFNVLWPRENPTYIAHFGRSLLSYESSKFACVDLRNLELLAPYEAQARIEPHA